MRRTHRWVASGSWVVLLRSLAAAACSSKGGMASGRSATVVAAGASTTLAFINGDPPGDGSNFLDNVTLR